MPPFKQQEDNEESLEDRLSSEYTIFCGLLLTMNSHYSELSFVEEHVPIYHKQTECSTRFRHAQARIFLLTLGVDFNAALKGDLFSDRLLLSFSVILYVMPNYYYPLRREGLARMEAGGDLLLFRAVWLLYALICSLNYDRVYREGDE